MSDWYISFAGEEGFRGACIVTAENEDEAFRATAKVNPGGQVLLLRVPDGHVVAPKFRNRLLSKEDIAEMDGGAEPKSIKDMSDEEWAHVEEHSTMICENHGRMK